MTIPIFIVVYNRVWCLKRCFRAIRTTAPRQPVVFIDNGSDYAECKQWLEKRKKQGFTVYHFPKIKGRSGLIKSIQDAVALWVKSNGKVLYYVVTDPDVELCNPKLRWLQSMKRVLRKHPGIDCVGPSLDISDIPNYYPLKRQVIRQEKKFWKSESRIRGRTPFFKSRIDTTFGMYRGTYVKRGVTRKSARLCRPFIAKHLDWYINPAKMTKDQVHYLNAKRGLTHYGGQSLKDQIHRIHL